MFLQRQAQGAPPFRARCWRLASQDPGGQTLTPFGPIAARPWPARNRLPGFHARSGGKGPQMEPNSPGC